MSRPLPPHVLAALRDVEAFARGGAVGLPAPMFRAAPLPAVATPGLASPRGLLGARHRQHFDDGGDVGAQDQSAGDPTFTPVPSPAPVPMFHPDLSPAPHPMPTSSGMGGGSPVPSPAPTPQLLQNGFDQAAVQKFWGDNAVGGVPRIAVSGVPAGGRDGTGPGLGSRGQQFPSQPGPGSQPSPAPALYHPLDDPAVRASLHMARGGAATCGDRPARGAFARGGSVLPAHVQAALAILEEHRRHFEDGGSAGGGGGGDSGGDGGDGGGEHGSGTAGGSSDGGSDGHGGGDNSSSGSAGGVGGFGGSSSGDGYGGGSRSGSAGGVGGFGGGSNDGYGGGNSSSNSNSGDSGSGGSVGNGGFSPGAASGADSAGPTSSGSTAGGVLGGAGLAGSTGPASATSGPVGSIAGSDGAPAAGGFSSPGAPATGGFGSFGATPTAMSTAGGMIGATPTASSLRGETTAQSMASEAAHSDGEAGEDGTTSLGSVPSTAQAFANPTFGLGPVSPYGAMPSGMDQAPAPAPSMLGAGIPSSVQAAMGVTSPYGAAPSAMQSYTAPSATAGLMASFGPDGSITPGSELAKAATPYGTGLGAYGLSTDHMMGFDNFGIDGSVRQSSLGAVGFTGSYADPGNPNADADVAHTAMLGNLPGPEGYVGGDLGLGTPTTATAPTVDHLGLPNYDKSFSPDMTAYNSIMNRGMPVSALKGADPGTAPAAAASDPSFGATPPATAPADVVAAPPTATTPTPEAAAIPATLTISKPSPYTGTDDEVTASTADGYQATPTNAYAYHALGPEAGYAAVSLPADTPIGEAGIPASVQQANPSLFAGAQTVGDLRANIAVAAATAGPTVTSTVPNPAAQNAASAGSPAPAGSQTPSTTPGKNADGDPTTVAGTSALTVHGNLSEAALGGYDAPGALSTFGGITDQQAFNARQNIANGTGTAADDAVAAGYTAQQNSPVGRTVGLGTPASTEAAQGTNADGDPTDVNGTRALTIHGDLTPDAQAMVDSVGQASYLGQPAPANYGPASIPGRHMAAGIQIGRDAGLSTFGSDFTGDTYGAAFSEPGTPTATDQATATPAPNVPGLPPGALFAGLHTLEGGILNGQVDPNNQTHYGPAQFNQPTFSDTVAKHPELGIGTGLSMFNATSDQYAAVTQAHWGDVQAAITTAGFDATPANTYMGWNLGITGAINALKAGPDATLAQAGISPAIQRANPSIYGGISTVGQLQASLTDKLQRGDAGSASVASATGSAPSTSGTTTASTPAGVSFSGGPSAGPAAGSLTVDPGSGNDATSTTATDAAQDHLSVNPSITNVAAGIGLGALGPVGMGIAGVNTVSGLLGGPTIGSMLNGALAGSGGGAAGTPGGRNDSSNKPGGDSSNSTLPAYYGPSAGSGDGSASSDPASTGASPLDPHADAMAAYQAAIAGRGTGSGATSPASGPRPLLIRGRPVRSSASTPLYRPMEDPIVRRALGLD